MGIKSDYGREKKKYEKQNQLLLNEILCSFSDLGIEQSLIGDPQRFARCFVFLLAYGLAHAINCIIKTHT